MPTQIYKTADGKRAPSVTTILGRWKESGGLIGWAYNQGYEHGAAGLPPNRYGTLREAGGIGTYAHALFEWHLNGENGPQPDPAQLISAEYLTLENIARGQNAFKEAKNWQSQSDLFLISSEQPLVSERYRYGGTRDGDTERQGKIGIADWKTSNRIYADYLLQLAAYWLLVEECLARTISDGVHIVRFSKDYGDFSHYHFQDLEIEKRQFIRLREAYEDDKLIAKRI